MRSGEERNWYNDHDETLYYLAPRSVPLLPTAQERRRGGRRRSGGSRKGQGRRRDQQGKNGQHNDPEFEEWKARYEAVIAFGGQNHRDRGRREHAQWDVIHPLHRHPEIPERKDDELGSSNGWSKEVRVSTSSAGEPDLQNEEHGGRLPRPRPMCWSFINCRHHRREEVRERK